MALSPKGRALATRLIPIAEGLEQTAIAGLSAKDIAVVKRLLTRMHGNLSAKR